MLILLLREINCLMGFSPLFCSPPPSSSLLSLPACCSPHCFCVWQLSSTCYTHTHTHTSDKCLSVCLCCFDSGPGECECSLMESDYKAETRDTSAQKPSLYNVLPLQMYNHTAHSSTLVVCFFYSLPLSIFLSVFFFSYFSVMIY